MAKQVTESNRRDAEILLAALRLIKINGGEMKYGAIKEELPKVFQFTDNELAPRNTWAQGWYTVLGMVGGIELKAVGIVDIQKGTWFLTEAGEKALDMTPDDFYRLYHNRWHEIQKAKKAKEKQQSENNETDSTETVEITSERDIETIIEKAREQIRQYIIKKDPYEFQFLVAALFRGMGYFTPFIAPKGKDGGIDIVAFRDPLGIERPHLKIQVKHRLQAAIATDVVQSLIGAVLNDKDICIIATSGRFTNDAVREARRSSRNVRLLDMEELIDLWIENYDKLSEDDKHLLPLTPIYHLNEN